MLTFLRQSKLQMQVKIQITEARLAKLQQAINPCRNKSVCMYGLCKTLVLTFLTEERGNIRLIANTNLTSVDSTIVWLSIQ